MIAMPNSGTFSHPRRFSGSRLQNGEYFLNTQMAFMRGLTKKAEVIATVQQGREKVEVEILLIEPSPGQCRRKPEYYNATAMFPGMKVATLRLRATQTLRINPTINE